MAPVRTPIEPLIFLIFRTTNVSIQAGFGRRRHRRRRCRCRTVDRLIHSLTELALTKPLCFHPFIYIHTYTYMYIYTYIRPVNKGG